MLTPKQEDWLEHLSTEKKVCIIPFDPTAEKKFQKIKSLIQGSLGADVAVEHRGSTSLGISGQDEIDVYIPVLAEEFSKLQPKLEELFGEPRSAYPSRIRFHTEIDSKKIDLFLIDKKHEDWLNGIAFEKACRDSPEILEKYRILKEEMNGRNVQEFYRQKNEFINTVLELTGTSI